jgi:hypothetical protein
MATFSLNFPEAMETRAKEWFFMTFTQLPLLFPALFDRRPSTKRFEDRIRAAGFGTFMQKSEGSPVSFDDPIEGLRVRSLHTVYALGYRATWEAIEDDQWDVLDRMPQDLGESARDHQERIAWSLENDGFAGDTFTGLDDPTPLALYHTAHTTLRPEVATQSNSLSPALELGVTGLETAMTTFRTTRSEEGRQLNVMPRKLVFHPNLQHSAYTLLQTEFRPGTADNDRSTVASTRSGITPVADGGIPYLTSQTAWSLHTNPGGKESLLWYDRARLFFERARDALTWDQLHYAGYRAHPAIGEWRGHVGSNFS